MGKEKVYLPEMPEGAMIVTKDMIIIGTGEKYVQKEVKHHEGLLSQARVQV